MSESARDRSALALASIFVGILIAAFVGGWAGVESRAESSTASPVAGSPVASPAASPSAQGEVPGQSVSVADSVTIHLTDQGFMPNHVESTNGHDLTITLVNSGSRRHGFRIDHYDIDVLLDPGETTTVVIHQPDLGDFTFYSDAPGDEGMHGTLTFYI
jgi:uncharacterized cupredoxin-like copper-binding protein